MRGNRHSISSRLPIADPEGDCTVCSVGSAPCSTARSDAHVDAISAFIRNLRGSDPDATVCWLARTIYAGEAPHFILRRMLIIAGEDIGLADAQAQQVAAAGAQVVIGATAAPMRTWCWLESSCVGQAA